MEERQNGHDFWNHLLSFMNDLGFQYSRADPDAWFRLAKRGGEEYDVYILLYTNNYLVIFNQAGLILRNEIGKCFVLKEQSIGPPKHVGTRIDAQEEV